MKLLFLLSELLNIGSKQRQVYECQISTALLGCKDLNKGAEKVGIIASAIRWDLRDRV